MMKNLFSTNNNNSGIVIHFHGGGFISSNSGVH